MIQPDAQYRHKWRKGDIVIWDNRCSYHKAAGDYPPEEDRIHWRVSINDYGVEALVAAGEGAMTLEVLPFEAGLGADISGVDIGRPLTPLERDQIRAAWLDHLVLRFR